MTDKILGTDSYKGVRDFYPEDMAVQRYIFSVWSDTAESFGFERYDASVLEPSELYKAKGSENEEMVNEQTYTFIDRGKREVTLRPEMTPTVARMIAGKRRELSFPVRWYSIPNLFRYERPQRGRLREHWQLNCDIFGADHFTADIEIIALAYQMLINFGAEADMFEIRINNRAVMDAWYSSLGITNADTRAEITKLNDRKNKISEDDYRAELRKLLPEPFNTNSLKNELESNDISKLETDSPIKLVIAGLNDLGITNVVFDKTIARGFNYYTGTVFEIFDISGENNRAMLGGGRYDNLTGMFGGEAITGIGFGMGDVTMRDFLETHDLLTSNITSPDLMIIPTDANFNLPAQIIANDFRNVAGLSVATDISNKKLGKKIGEASDKMVDYIIVVGEDDVKNNLFTLKYLNEDKKIEGTIEHILEQFSEGKI